MSQTQDQKRFTMSEQVAADWHDLTIPQHTMQPSTVHVSKQLDLNGHFMASCVRNIRTKRYQNLLIVGNVFLGHSVEKGQW